MPMKHEMITLSPSYQSGTQLSTNLSNFDKYDDAVNMLEKPVACWLSFGVPISQRDDAKLKECENLRQENISMVQAFAHVFLVKAPRGPLNYDAKEGI